MPRRWDFRHKLQYRLGRVLDWLYAEDDPNLFRGDVTTCPHCKTGLNWLCGSCGNVMTWYEYRDMPIYDFRDKELKYRAGDALICKPCGLKYGFKRLSDFEKELFFSETQYLMVVVEK